MTRPGTVVSVLSTPPPGFAPTDTGVWFAAGLCDQGRSDMPTLIQSIDDFNTYLGGRQTYSVMYDAIETFFREGGATCYVARVVGPAAAKAAHNLLDASAGISLVVNAIGPGAYGNSLKVQVLNGVVSGYQVQVLDSNNNVLENSGDLQLQTDAVNWSQYSKYVRITLGASALVPAVAAAALLSGGNDDRGNITDAQWLAALNLFTKDMRPGADT